MQDYPLELKSFQNFDEAAWNEYADKYDLPRFRTFLQQTGTYVDSNLDEYDFYYRDSQNPYHLTQPNGQLLEYYPLVHYPLEEWLQHCNSYIRSGWTLDKPTTNKQALYDYCYQTEVVNYLIRNKIVATFDYEFKKPRSFNQMVEQWANDYYKYVVLNHYDFHKVNENSILEFNEKFNPNFVNTKKKNKLVRK